MKRRKKSRLSGVAKFSYAFLGTASIIFIFPMIVAFIVSISSRESILHNGFSLIPDSLSLEAYELLVVHYWDELGRAILLTVGTGILQPLITVFLTMCMAYPLSQPDFFGKSFWRRYLLVTMLFSGGLVPSYILNANYLGLRDDILIYLLPAIGAWNVFLFRTFFTSIDKSMVESAKMDGANKMQILLKIMLPLTKPLVAMNFFSGFLSRWNDISTPLYYIRERKLYTVQYLLQEMLRSAEEAKALIKMGLLTTVDTSSIPVDQVRFALAVIGALPALILFPFLQKYYSKGIMVGSTKG